MIDFPNWQLHRGYWQNGVRENTLEAFIQARKAGAQMVELDVQLSKDGIVHVFHDYDLKKFFHIDKLLSKMSSQDLEVLNISTLEKVLKSDLVPEFLNIEIKSIDLFPLKLTKKVCEVIRECGENKKILVSSFNPMCLYWARVYLRETQRALIVGDRASLMDWKWSFSMKLAQPHYINAKYRLYEDEVCQKKLKSHKLPLMLWTVNDAPKAAQFLEEGVKSIISDHVQST